MGASTTNSITQDRYKINDVFLDRDKFLKFFETLQTKLGPWFKTLVDELPGLFDKHTTNSWLQSILPGLLTPSLGLVSQVPNSHSTASIYCLTSMSSWLDFPFVTPNCPVIGFGGAFGAQLLQEKNFVASDSQQSGESGHARSSSTLPGT
jgi:hypothetical protein